MNIGILTLPLHINYGGILQAFALQTVLERMGHKAHIISISPRPKKGLIGIIRRTLKPVKTLFYVRLVPNKFSTVKDKYTSRFIREWIHQDKIYSFKDIRENQYDVFIVGSDQIWRKYYIDMLPNMTIADCYLDFTKDWNTKRISYAASFGTDVWEYSLEETQQCEQLLRKFDAISVREKSGISLCKKYFHQDVVQVLDPTLLLSKDDYLELIPKTDKQNSGIMTYILDESNGKNKFVLSLSKQLNMAFFKTNVSFSDFSNVPKGRIQPPLENWLCGFRDADLVVTDSFHACVFSIIFNKPFIVIPNVERGSSRFHSLLQMFNQEYRIIEDLEQKIPQIIFESPNCNISELRKFSLDFLRKSLLA